MELSLYGGKVVERVLVIFILMLFGIIGRRSGLIKEEAQESLGDVMLNLTLPPLIFVSMVSDINFERLAIGWLLPLVSFIMVLIGVFIANKLGKLLSISQGCLGTFKILCSMPNTAFIGFPIILSLLGKEGLAYAVLFDFGITVAFFSVAILVLEGEKGEFNWLSALKNPPFLAVIVGLIVNKLNLEIPGLIMEALQTMGNTTTPLAMLIMGSMIAGVKFSIKSFDLKLVAVCFFKLCIYPLLAVIILAPLRLDPLIRAVIIIETAMPSMASTPVLVQKYGGDETFAASGTFLTTLCSVFTIPLMIYLLV